MFRVVVFVVRIGLIVLLWYGMRFTLFSMFVYYFGMVLVASIGLVCCLRLVVWLLFVDLGI